jgi:hypothetical protein
VVVVVRIYLKGGKFTREGRWNGEARPADTC